MQDDVNMPSADMLAFSYRIRKVIRDMRHVDLPSEEAEAKREQIVMSLEAVCRDIDDAYQ